MSTFNYEKSDREGIRVNPNNSDDPKKDAVKRELANFRSISGGGSKVWTEEGEIHFETSEKENAARVNEDGTLEWFGDIRVHGEVQGQGKRIEVFQNVVATGDNLIELNANATSLKVPYSGIEVNRGEDSSAFLLFTEDSRRWTSVIKGERRRTVALHGDSLKNFKQDLTTDDVEEGDQNSYSSPLKSSQNFWISGEVERTVEEDKEILPAFISVGDDERKLVTKIRAKLSSGLAEVVLLLNGKQKGPSIILDPAGKEDMQLPLEDGDEVSISVLNTSEAKNLSVSIEVTRYVT